MNDGDGGDDGYECEGMDGRTTGGKKEGDGGTATLSCALLRRSCMIIIGSM